MAWMAMFECVVIGGPGEPWRGFDFHQLGFRFGSQINLALAFKKRVMVLKLIEKRLIGPGAT